MNPDKIEYGFNGIKEIEHKKFAANDAVEAFENAIHFILNQNPDLIYENIRGKLEAGGFIVYRYYEKLEGESEEDPVEIAKWAGYNGA